MKKLVLIITLFVLSYHLSSAQKQQPDLYIISIGIDSNYLHGDAGSWSHAISDANKLSKHAKQQFNKMSQGKIHEYLLVDKNATHFNIDSSFQSVIKSAKADDYFIFYFAGFTTTFESEKSLIGTYFYPYDAGCDKINSPNDFLFENLSKDFDVNKLNLISLKKLKNWLELITAKNQLLITESGPNENFINEFSMTLIDKDPLITLLANRNRVIITTNGYGKDNCTCNNGISINGGPLLEFIVKTDTAIFQLFDSTKREFAKYAILKNEFACEMDKQKFQKPVYTSIFFEKDLINTLNFYKNKLTQSRGVKLKENSDEKDLNSNIEKPKSYALIIGTEKFSDLTEWSNLSNPKLDAETISKELKENYNFETELLINPSKKEIVETLLKYRRMKFNEKDQLFIFVAGHGYFDSEFSDGFIVASDSKSLKEDISRETYFQFATFNKIIDNIDCRHIFLVLDVCFGGNFGDNAKTLSNRGITIYNDTDTKIYIENKMKYKTRLYFASGMKEVADGYIGSHSPFARRLLEAFRTFGGQDKILTTNEIINFADKNITQPIFSEFGSNEPGSDFLFITK
jgi:hypothetical protein